MRAVKQCCTTVHNFNFIVAMTSHREELSLLCRCQRKKPKQLNITQKKCVRLFLLNICSQFSHLELMLLLKSTAKLPIDFSKNKVMVLLGCWLGDSTVTGLQLSAYISPATYRLTLGTCSCFYFL